LSILLWQPLTAQEVPAIKVFQERLRTYVNIRKVALEKMPAVGKNATAQEIERSETTLAALIRNARPQANQGDILAPDVRSLFQRILRSGLNAKDGKATQASIKEGNPKFEKAPGEVEPMIQVNAQYPKNAPLSTIPPFMLLMLPQLPKDIEYRFVGRTLILRDALSNLIIDYMKEAVPAI